MSDKFAWERMKASDIQRTVNDATRYNRKPPGWLPRKRRMKNKKKRPANCRHTKIIQKIISELRGRKFLKSMKNAEYNDFWLSFSRIAASEADIFHSESATEQKNDDCLTL